MNYIQRKLGKIVHSCIPHSFTFQINKMVTLTETAVQRSQRQIGTLSKHENLTNYTHWLTFFDSCKVSSSDRLSSSFRFTPFLTLTNSSSCSAICSSNAIFVYKYSDNNQRPSQSLKTILVKTAALRCAHVTLCYSGRTVGTKWSIYSQSCPIINLLNKTAKLNVKS